MTVKKHPGYGTALPKTDSIYQIQCPIIYALDLVGGKWKLPIMWYLFGSKTVRYNELKRSVVGVTNMMLSKCLKELEGAGLVVRFQYPEIPPKVEYSLTERGQRLIPALQEVYKWGETQLALDGKSADRCSTGEKNASRRRHKRPPLARMISKRRDLYVQ